jgi:hypothetical protein
VRSSAVTTVDEPETDGPQRQVLDTEHDEPDEHGKPAQDQLKQGLHADGRTVPEHAARDRYQRGRAAERNHQPDTCRPGPL